MPIGEGRDVDELVKVLDGEEATCKQATTRLQQSQQIRGKVGRLEGAQGTG